ncbi:DNA recombination protein RmuC [Candidatus Saccharibacteria bacterium]|nr:DNA recombination protein RmuC [Candidatus Saccharibacteria bacterium]
MIAALIIVGVLIGAGLIIASIYFFGQKFILQLTQANDAQRKGNKEEIESGVKGILSDHNKLLAQTIKGLEKQLDTTRKDAGSLREQNAAIREQLANTAKITEGLQVSTESLKNLLSNNRLRGDWGEQIAEDLLLAAGFVEKLNYIKQTATASGRPDFTILLPDGYKLNVDAKFPFDDLISYQEAENAEDKRRALSSFRAAVKTKIKELSSRDYINPEEQTLDFVIMFIPNEMIFSFIYEKVPDINQFANERKVILAGPFGFTAVLRLVLQAHKNFHHEKSLMQILGLISKFQDEYEKFGSSLEKLGKQIDTTKSTYTEIEGTRSRQLTKVVRQISEHSTSEKTSKLLSRGGLDE